MSDSRLPASRVPNKQPPTRPARPPVALIVSDIDGTITDFFGMWAQSIDKAFDRLAKSRGIDRSVIEHQAREAGEREYYMHNLGKLMKQLPCLNPQPVSRQQRRKLEREDAAIMHEWQKDRAAAGHLFEGVLKTVRQARAAGTKFVLFTDSPHTSTIARLQIMGMPPDLLDAVYTQPDPPVKGTTGPLMDYTPQQAAFAQQLAGKTHVLGPGTHKPNPEVYKRICDDMGIPPELSVMVGDTFNDMATTRGTAAITAWQKHGASVSPETLKIFQKLNPMPDYFIGGDIVAQKMREGRVKPGITLERGFAELGRHVRFVSPGRILKGKRRFADALRRKRNASILSTALVKRARLNR